MIDLYIKNARIVNEGTVRDGHILVHQGRIRSILDGESPQQVDAGKTIDAGGLFLIPGLIDKIYHLGDRLFSIQPDRSNLGQANY